MRAAKFAQICLAAGLACAIVTLLSLPGNAKQNAQEQDTSFHEGTFGSFPIATNPPYPGCIHVHGALAIFNFDEYVPPGFTIAARTPVAGTVKGVAGARETYGPGWWYCPPLTPVVDTSGLIIGFHVIKITGLGEITERLIATGEITNFFKEKHDPAGFGVSIAYKFPWINSIAIAPFAEFDYLHLPVNHTFPNGSFLGTTANVAGTFGIKIGPQITQSLWVYGIAGVSVLNETLNINFIPVSSSRDATVAGATFGGGVAWQPSFLQGFGLPVALNFEYEHTWWQDAHFDAPAASPAFNYTFRRQDDLFKFGVTIALSPSAPAAERPIPVKTRPSK